MVLDPGRSDEFRNRPIIAFAVIGGGDSGS
jgi:hypothetical protein